MSSKHSSHRLLNAQSYPALQTLVQPSHRSNGPSLARATGTRNSPARSGGFDRLFGGEVTKRVRQRPASIPSSTASARETFEQIDTNNDGVIDFAEFEAAAQSRELLNSRSSRPGNGEQQLSNDQWAAQMMREMQMVERALTPNKLGGRRSAAGPANASPAPLPALEQGGVRTVLVLDGSVDQLPVPRRPWDESLLADIAAAVGTREERVLIAAIHAGSVVVWLDLLPGGPLEATCQELAGTLVAAVADNNSRLYTGDITRTVNRGKSLSKLASLGAAVGVAPGQSMSRSVSTVTVDNSLAVRRSVQAIYVAVNHWKQQQTHFYVQNWRSLAADRKRRRLRGLQGTFKWRHDQVAQAVVLWWKVCIVERDSANMVNWVVAYGKGQGLAGSFSKWRILATAADSVATFETQAANYWQQHVLVCSITVWKIHTTEQAALRHLVHRGALKLQQLRLSFAVGHWISVTGHMGCCRASAAAAGSWWNRGVLCKVLQLLRSKLGQTQRKEHFEASRTVPMVAKLYLNECLHQWQRTSLEARESLSLLQWAAVWWAFRVVQATLVQWQQSSGRLAHASARLESSRYFWTGSESLMRLQHWRVVTRKMQALASQAQSSQWYWHLGRIVWAWDIWSYHASLVKELVKDEHNALMHWQKQHTRQMLAAWVASSGSVMHNTHANLRAAQNIKFAQFKQWRIKAAAHVQELKAMSTKGMQQAREKAMAAAHLWRLASIRSMLRLWHNNTRTGMQATVNVDKASFAVASAVMMSKRGSFTRWHWQSVAAVAEIRALKRAGAHNVASLLRSGLDQWLTQLMQCNSTSAAIQQALDMWFLPKATRTLQLWQIIAVRMREARVALRTVVKRWRLGLLMCALISWRETCGACCVLHSKWQHIFEHYKQAFTAKLVPETLAAAGRQQRQKLGYYTRFFRMGQLHVYIAQWRAVANHKSAIQAKQLRACKACFLRAERQALNKWLEYHVEILEFKRAMLRAIGLGRQQDLACALQSLRECAENSQSSQRQFNAIARRLMKRQLWKAFKTWLLTANEVSPAETQLRRAAQWWLQRGLVWGTLLWRHVASHVRILQVSLAIGAHHHRVSTLIRWFVSWNQLYHDHRQRMAQDKFVSRRPAQTAARPYAGYMSPGGVPRKVTNLDGPMGRSMRSGFMGARSKQAFGPAASHGPVEAPGEVIDRMFDAADVNADGMLDRTEFVAAYQRGTIVVPQKTLQHASGRNDGAAGVSAHIQVAHAIMQAATGHEDGYFSVPDCPATLARTRFESFASWISNVWTRHQHLNDGNQQGILSITQLEAAVLAFMQEQAEPGWRSGWTVPASHISQATKRLETSQESRQAASSKRPPARRQEVKESQTSDQGARSSNGGSAIKSQYVELANLLERCRAKGELQELFMHYSSSEGELTSQKFGRMMTDTFGIDNTLSSGVINIAFLQAIRTGPKRRSRMQWSQLLLGLAMVIMRKYPLATPPEALEVALRNHLQPLCMRLGIQSKH